MSSLKTAVSVRVRLLIWLGYWAFLFVIMHTPVEHTGLPKVRHLDKVGHFLFYATLTVLGAWRMSLPNTWASSAVLLRWALIFITYGALDEYLQQFVQRDTDFYDWVADVAGVAVATVVIAQRRRRLSQHGESGPGLSEPGGTV